MTNLSRRDFLKVMGLGTVGLVGALALAGCGDGASKTGTNTGSDSANTGSSENTATGKTVENVVNEIPTTSQDSITFGASAAITTLQPYLGVGLVPTLITYGVYETLFAFGEDNTTLEPRLAKGVQTDDNLTYDVEIYDNIYDSNGNHITADDVVFSFHAYKESGVGLAKTESIEKTGDYSVRIVVVDNAIGTWDDTVRKTAIVSEKEYNASEDGFSTAPVGTGMYAVTEFKPGISLTVTKRDDYWQADESKRAFLASANMDELTQMVIAEASQLAVALQTGAIDLASIPQAVADPFMGNSDYAFFPLTAPLGLQVYFSGDAHSPVADNQKLRQAILYAIDVDAIITVAYDGYGERQYTFGPSAASDFQEKWRNEDYYNYDVDKAKALLEEAGYKPGELHLQILSIGAIDAWSKACQVMQQNLSAIGIDLEILNYEAALYGSYMNDGQYYDMLINNVTQNYLVTAWNAKLGAQNFGGKTCTSIDDPKLQELLKGCLFEENHTPENVDAFHSYLKEQAYAYGLCAPQNFTFAKKEVGMVEPYYDYIGGMYLPCCKYAGK